MANNRNEIVGPETDHITQADYFLYCNFPNATDQMQQNLSKFNRSENQKRFHKILDDLIHSTIQMMKNKQIDFILRDLNTSTSCKPEEIPTRIPYNAIEHDIKIDRIKQRMIETITSTTQFGEDSDKTWHENSSSIAKDFGSLRHTDYATKYMDDIVPERGCASQCTGARTQSDIMDREFSSETNLDAFMKACEERRHADFILDEIARISDALTERVHLASEAKSEGTDSSSHIILTADEKEEEIFEKAKSLMSIICAQERPSAVTTEAVSKVVIQQETFVDSRVSISSIHFVQESQDPSAYLDATDGSRVAARIQVISSIEEPSKDESAHEVSSLYPEKGDFQDTTVTVTVKSDKKKEEKRKEDEIFLRSIIDTVVLAVFQNVRDIPTVVKDDGRKEDEEKRDGEEIDISLQQVLDKNVPAVETVDSSITDSIQELREDSDQIITFPPKQEAVSVINDISLQQVLDEDVPAVDKIVEAVDSDQIITFPPKQEAVSVINDISLQQVLDEDVPAVDKIVQAVDSSIVDSIQELREDSKQIIAFSPKQEAVSIIDDIIDSFVDFSQIEQEPTKIAKDNPRELVSYKMPKYRSIDAYWSPDISKTFIERNYFITKREKMPQCKEIRHAKHLNVSCTFLSFTSFEPTRRSYCEIPAAKMCQDDRSRLPRILQPIRCCGGLIPSNIYLGKPKYYDIWTTSCFNPQIAATREATLSVLCPSPQDSRTIGCRVSCRTLIDNRNASLRHCNVNYCTKRRAIFGDSSHTTYDTCCKVGRKHCYSRLNNNINDIGNVRMGYYHCNDNCPVWNNNRYYERSRSFHWCTRGNLYFIHPWPSRRYN